MTSDIPIHAIGPPQEYVLRRMYDLFEPPGAALGLPPPAADMRARWVAESLRHAVNVAAYSRDGDVIGHCFLAADSPHSAELAVFVHQDFRRQGIGSAMLTKALDWASAAGLRRVWSLTASDNRAALRLQERCGFRLARYAFPAVELEIDLPPQGSSPEMPKLACALPRQTADHLRLR